MSIRLLKDCFAREEVNDLLVACYAIGWRITEEELEKYPHLRFATGETDTGVIISFNSEGRKRNGFPYDPRRTRTLAINPLNWKTDSTPALPGGKRRCLFYRLQRFHCDRDSPPDRRLY